MIMLLTLSTTIHASDLSTLTEEQEQVKEDISGVTDKINKFESEIEDIQAEIDENDSKIEELEAKQDDNEKSIEGSKDEIGQSLVMMQKLDNSNTLATYFYDENSLENNYFLKVENINTLFDSLSENMAVFIQEIEVIQGEIDDINDLKKDNKKKIEKLETKVADQQELEDNLKAQLAEVEEEIGEISTTSTSGSVSGSKESIMAAAGISSSDYTYVDYIITKESGWNATAANPVSSAYGLCQSLPGSKMASAGSDWQTNAVTQLKWCDSYATGRYGSWGSAYNFWITNNWW